ncbi:MAG: di-trans,poly-cis-decaprenylcistransferase [Epulopiscium sp. Nuni2H_MBin003]|nr:MAG: di-trans,poly-cis-decaprenylcistransferase [Epulopiscium sp. Nuni2H_MBin003]
MKKDVPTHVAIIMDGNGRWANAKKMPRNAGHKVGSETLQDIVEYAEELGISYITVYAFSTENWSRPKEEVDGIMKLLDNYLSSAIKKASYKSIRAKVIGRKDELSPKLVEKIEKLEHLTRDKKGICVIFAINYGGRDEIVRAIAKMATDLEKDTLKIQDISEDMVTKYLDTADIPDPDFLIRTSGELRTSNFLPWQLAYSEFYFTNKMWPDFSRSDFDLAINEYTNRKRRFGKSE